MRQGRATVRQTAQKPAVYKSISIPSPTLGLIANANLASPQPGGAYVLENWLPTATGALMRRGTVSQNQLGDGTQTVRSLFSYVNGNNEKLFAAIDTAIYDVTSAVGSFALVDNLSRQLIDDQGNPLIAFPVAPLSPVVSGQTSGSWSVVQFATPGGVFLRAVNGADTPLVYDGTSWSTSPAITGVDPKTLSYTFVHQKRLFFIKEDSLSAWYLPADSIGGAAVELPLGGVFSLGGSLLFGSTWSLETGGGGLQENCIFVTTEGEVVVYQGSDPSTAATWSKVGIYRIGKPLGPQAHFRAGGDIVILTDVGAIPLSQALQKDFAVLSPTAVSAQIETIWNTEVANRVGANWSCVVWSTNQMAVVAPPTINDQPAVMYVVNSRTGGWGKYTGWNGTCLAVFRNRLFFGSVNGQIIEANVGGLDMGVPYTATFIPSFSDFGSQGAKTIGMTRAVLRSTMPVTDKLSMQREFRVSLPSPPDASMVNSANVWDAGTWGASVWGAPNLKETFEQWRSTPSTGYALAPALQVTSGSLVPIDVEVIRLDVTYTPGDVVT